MATTPQRIRGAFLGLAVCDALGGPVEFRSRGSFPLVTKMLPNNNFALPEGCFTDDTSQALCLAHSLLENEGKVDPIDQASKYVSWYRKGYMSVTGNCFDIGSMTRAVLAWWERFIRHELGGLQPGSVGAKQAVQRQMAVVEQSFSNEHYCGNGSLMRGLPTGMISINSEKTMELARECSKTTHPHKRCQDACAAYAVLVQDALLGKDEEHLATELRWILRGSSIDTVLRRRFGQYRGVEEWKDKDVIDISSSGYVVNSLEAALWAFFTTDSFKDGAIKVVNLGDDADTVGAIYGGLAGAFYGVQGIPTEWLKAMKKLDMVEDVAKEMTTFYNAMKSAAS